MNLIEDRWLPVIRESGYARVAPHEITDGVDPVLRLAATRPDFNASLLQFLIALVQTSTPPVSNTDWVDRYLTPPDPAHLQAQFAAFAPYFALDGDGIRFMQDFAPAELAEQEPNDIAALLIEAPGEQTTKFNKDLFVKRGGTEALCGCCTAAALFTLQTNAPPGGAGNNTSLRGGGPLTTFVMATPLTSAPVTLWRSVWLNVVERITLGRNHPDAERITPAAVFPWSAPTRVSEDRNGAARKVAKKSGGETPDKQRPQVTYADGHPLLVYWATPRRIVLDFEAADSGDCDLCGEPSARRVRQYRAKNYGANYTAGWRHPLSPYYRMKPADGEFLPLHLKGGLGYRDWLGLVGSAMPSMERASVVGQFLSSRRRALDERLRSVTRMPFRIHACGYEMDKMKPLCWHEAVMPLPMVDPERIEGSVQQLMGAADLAASILRGALKSAWFSPGATVRSDFTFATDAFWQLTELDFYLLLKELNEASSEDFPSDEALMKLRQDWHRSLRRGAENLFELHAESGPAEQGNAKRVALARQQMRRNLHGPKLKTALGLPVDAPATDKSAAARKKAAAR